MIALVLLYTSSQLLFSQGTLPDIPDIIRVTVDHGDGGVLIQWEPSADSDIEFYTIYKQRDQVFEIVATISADSVKFKHLGGGGRNLSYAVTAVDSSGNESLFADNVHRAVSATVEFDPCVPTNTLTWNGYTGWENHIAGYRIYGGIQGSTLPLLGFVSSSTQHFSHTGITVGMLYDYYIETVHISGLVSLSAIETISSLYPEAPRFLSVDWVSVTGPGTVELQFSVDVESAVNDFRVMKRSGPDTPFIQVQEILDAIGSTQLIEDHFPTSANTFEYQVQSIFSPPSCSAPIVISTSNSGTNILLEYEFDDHSVFLNWTPYNQYANGLSGYTIQRRSGNGAFLDLQTVAPGTTSWTETVQSIIDGFQPGEVQYRVIAKGNQGGTGNPGQSVSNIVSVGVETTLKLPSAFTPGSNDMNFEFKPIIDFAPKDYRMMVLDRSGRKLFETNDPGQGWDGRSGNGHFVSEGVYIYYIQFTDYTGRFKSFTGNLTVLYP